LKPAKEQAAPKSAGGDEASQDFNDGVEKTGCRYPGEKESEIRGAAASGLDCASQS
jgi:hypothetical protein